MQDPSPPTRLVSAPRVDLVRECCGFRRAQQASTAIISHLIFDHMRDTHPHRCLWCTTGCYQAACCIQCCFSFGFQRTRLDRRSCARRAPACSACSRRSSVWLTGSAPSSSSSSASSLSLAPAACSAQAAVCAEVPGQIGPLYTILGHGSPSEQVVVVNHCQARRPRGECRRRPMHAHWIGMWTASAGAAGKGSCKQLCHYSGTQGPHPPSQVSELLPEHHWRHAGLASKGGRTWAGRGGSSRRRASAAARMRSPKPCAPPGPAPPSATSPAGAAAAAPPARSAPPSAW
jgi:hypothetical protein